MPQLLTSVRQSPGSTIGEATAMRSLRATTKEKPAAMKAQHSQKKKNPSSEFYCQGEIFLQVIVRAQRISLY